MKKTSNILNLYVLLLMCINSFAYDFGGFSVSNNGETIITGPLRKETAFLMQESKGMCAYTWSNETNDWLSTICTGKSINDVGLSPSGKYIVIIDYTPPEKTYETAIQYFNLYNSEKQLIALYDNIYMYSFSSNEKYLAMSIVDYGTEKDIITDTVLLDISTKQSYSLGKQASVMSWAKHDGKLYYIEVSDTNTVFCYDTETKETKATPYKGLYFSSDGKYYYNITHGEITIFRTVDNECIFNNNAKNTYSNGITGADWLCDNVIVFFLGKKHKDIFGRTAPHYGVATLNLSTHYMCYFPVSYCIGLDKQNKRLVSFNEGKIYYSNIDSILLNESNSEPCIEISFP